MSNSSNISDEPFYRFLIAQNPENILNKHKLGLDKFKTDPLVAEVRRRCETNLWFLGKYFLWDTDVVGAGKPIEENFTQEHVHRRVCDMFIVKDKTKRIGEQDPNFKDRLILYPRGAGKALDLDTPIPTPSGFSQMRDIKQGDVVLSSAGTPCLVTHVSPVFNGHKCYEVEFSSGEVITADEGHLWVTETRRQRDASRNGSLKQRATPVPSVKTTKEILESLTWERQRNHRVRVSHPIRLDDRVFSISPYVLGCWLGDGTSTCGALTNADFGIIEEIRREGETIRKSDNPSDKYLWRFNGGVGHPTFRKQKSSFIGRLRSLNLIGNKHIPIQYLRGSYEQRVSLLQGLMDTDGTCDKRGSSSFCNTNKQLADDTRELVASLGMKPSRLCEKDAKIYGRIVGKAYNFSFTAYIDTPVFRLSRKKERQPSRKKHSYADFRYIVDVRPVDTRPVRCITVDSSDHTYLVGSSYITTHNSAWDRYDTIQWVLNFPEIRLLYLTAEQDLAQGFVRETKNHFFIREDEPSLMNLYFPEYCFLEKDSGEADKLTCPIWAAKRIERKEPTVWGSSIESTLSGKHFEIIKADDSVSDENSQNESQCKKIADKYNLKRKMLVPTGYGDKIGTRYADEDMYGEDLKRNVGTNIKKQSGPNWEIIENYDLGLKILIGRSIVIKPEVVERLEKENRPVTYAEAGADGCTLLFPELHSYSWCMYEYGKNEVIFEGQQNQNPRSAVNPVFDLPLMMRHTIPFNDPIIPQSGPISQFWDFAFSKAKGRDYCTGSATIWNSRGQAAFIDLIRAKFKPLDLAKAIVEFAAKYKPYVIGIEKAGGSELLDPAIQTEAAKTNIAEVVEVCRRIDWVTPSNHKDAKTSRMRALHPWIAGDMMYFVSNLPYKEVMYEEFQRCLSGHHHDDIPDNFSYQTRYAPSAVQAIQLKEIEKFSRADGAWQYVFDASGELYGGWDNQYMPSPFKGYVLTVNPESGLFELVGEELTNPIVSVPTEESFEPVTRDAYDGMDNILGAGL